MRRSVDRSKDESLYHSQSIALFLSRRARGLLVRLFPRKMAALTSTVRRPKEFAYVPSLALDRLQSAIRLSISLARTYICTRALRLVINPAYIEEATIDNNRANFSRDKAASIPPNHYLPSSVDPHILGPPQSLVKASRPSRPLIAD